MPGKSKPKRSDVAERNFEKSVRDYAEVVPFEVVEKLIARRNEAIRSGNLHKFVREEFDEFLDEWRPVKPVMQERKEKVMLSANEYAREIRQ